MNGGPEWGWPGQGAQARPWLEIFFAIEIRAGFNGANLGHL